MNTTDTDFLRMAGQFWDAINSDMAYLDGVSLMYLQVGFLYILIASGRKDANCPVWRRRLSEKEKYIEAAIGTLYLVYAVEWVNILPGVLEHVA